MANIQRVTPDRFGNPTILITAKEKVDKKTKAVLDGLFQGYAELSGQLYKFELSPNKKRNEPAMWIKITKMSKQMTTAKI